MLPVTLLQLQNVFDREVSEDMKLTKDKLILTNAKAI